MQHEFVTQAQLLDLGDELRTQASGLAGGRAVASYADMASGL